MLLAFTLLLVSCATAMRVRSDGELGVAAENTCPYTQNLEGWTDCVLKEWDLDGEISALDRTCLDTESTRFRIANTFAEKNVRSFVESAKEFPLNSDLFDKTNLAAAHTWPSYEKMLSWHVKGLMHPSVVGVEDKILLKGMAEKLSVPATDMFFGAHASTWDPAKFRQALSALCEKNIDGFIIKPTHVAWSKGQKVQRNWGEVCKSSLESRLDELVAFVEKECIGAVNVGGDSEHLKYLEPGVTVEELFATGGVSRMPFEAKVNLLWGKVYFIVFMGEDHRGCKYKSGEVRHFTVYADGTGWDGKGPIGATGSNDEFTDVFREKVLPQLITYSEALARNVGADVTRADFFIGGLDAEPFVKLNELETVSGLKNVYERIGIADGWRGGYAFRDGKKFPAASKVDDSALEMTVAHWKDVVEAITTERRLNGL